MQEIMTKLVTKMIAGMYMVLILEGYITSPDQIPGNVDPRNLQQLAGVIMCENGSCPEVKCQFLTGVVPLNRLHSNHWDGDSIEEVIMAKDGGYIQYAYPTRNNFKTIKCSDLSLAIAKYLLLYYEPGLQADKRLMYQGMNKYAGSEVYWSDGHGEYFCLE